MSGELSNRWEVIYLMGEQLPINLYQPTQPKKKVLAITSSQIQPISYHCLQPQLIRGLPAICTSFRHNTRLRHACIKLPHMIRQIIRSTINLNSYKYINLPLLETGTQYSNTTPNPSSRVMQAANRLLKALRTGSGLTFGAWQMLPGSNHARTIARCGFDWVVVDTEHGNIDGKSVR